MGSKDNGNRRSVPTGLAESVESLAQTLVLSEVTDVDSLKEIGALLDTVAAMEPRGRLAVVGRAAQAATELIARVRTNDELEELFQVLNRTVSAMQILLRTECAVAEAGFPAELDIEWGETDADSGKKESVSSAPADIPAEKTASVANTDLPNDPAFFVGFVSEAREHLDVAEANLLTLEADPGDRMSVDGVFRAFHTVKGVAAFLGLEGIRALAHQAESLLEKARRKNSRLSTDDVALAIEATDALRKMIEDLAVWLEQGGDAPHADYADLVGRLREAAESESEEADTEMPAVIMATKSTKPDVSDSASQSRPVVKVMETVRLDAERLDRLLEMIGELVVTETMVTHAPEIRTGTASRLERELNRLDKITKELQDIGTSLRMVPVRGTFQKMARLARDLSHRFGKQIEFVTDGDDTEIDRSMVDQIADPLVHMVRNVVDHAIETPRQRKEIGKPATAHIELRAFHLGSSINIQVVDDGRGLDRNKILARARERGVVAADEQLSNQEVTNLIFRPGFSTANTVTDVSGRGVGLDVVKKNVESMHGRVEVVSEVGKGTTFTIRLPLTLAIIDGLMLRVGEERYIVPTLNVQRAVQLGPHGIQSVVGKGEMVDYDGHLVPLYRLSRLFQVAETGADENPVAILVEEEGRTVALLADELLGKQQYVIKSLGNGIAQSPGLSGCAILSDGSVGLILSISGLIQMARADEEDDVNPTKGER